MSTAPWATESGVTSPAVESVETPAETSSGAGSSRLLRGLLIGFTATVMIALGLACWYLSQRIQAASSAAPATPAVPHSSAARENPKIK